MNAVAQRNRSRVAAFTLVELLVAIAIISILAALLLGVATQAGKTARAARTKQLVARIHTLLMEKYESYRTERVETGATPAPTDLEVGTGFSGVAGLQPNDPRIRVYHRLAAVRELMKIEMPDRWSDVLLAEVPNPTTILSPNDLNTPTFQPRFLADRTQLNRLYIRRYNDAVANGATKAQLQANQGAECLYLTVMNATSDGEARSLFNEDDIGDTDGDGAPEFLDGWGNPISWLRWAPGFASDAHLSYDGLARVYNRDLNGRQGPFGSAGVTAETTADHDPIDLFRLDGYAQNRLPSSPRATADQMAPARGWRLLPLVYSAGSDEETGLRDDTGDAANPYVAGVDPYFDIDGSPANSPHDWLGEPLNEEDHVDNITNHLITAR